MSDVLVQIFGGDYPPEHLQVHQIAARAFVVYIIGVVAVRVGKSRIMSRTTTLDVLLGFILGSLLSRGVTGHASISGTTVACVVMIAIHWVLTSIACRSHWFGTVLKGHDRPVVSDGKILWQNMRRSHISEHDLMEELRRNGTENLAHVKEARKERNGEISVIKKKEPPHILEIAVKDGVQTVRIAIE